MSDPLDVLVDAIAEAVAQKIAERTPAPAPVPSPAAGTEWLSTAAAARYLGMKPKTLAEWRAECMGPVAHRVGRRAIRYSRTELDAYVRATRARTKGARP